MKIPPALYEPHHPPQQQLSRTHKPQFKHILRRVQMLWPFGERTFVQTHANSVILLDNAVKDTFHGTYKRREQQKQSFGYTIIMLLELEITSKL